MDVDASPTIVITSLGRRPSSVDTEVREEPTVRMDISQDQAFSPQLNAKVRYVKVTASTTIYVNELNTRKMKTGIYRHRRFKSGMSWHCTCSIIERGLPGYYVARWPARDLRFLRIQLSRTA
jgi:hypothetical protein